MKKPIRVALIGNPNSGKSTIFNNLTKLRQHVANYPGVTVEKKQGFCRYDDTDFIITDLPGIYSLTAHSLDETIARKELLTENPDIIIQIVDATQLEKSLYLTTQLMELKIPILLAFNMIDLVEKKNIAIDIPKLSSLLETAIVPTIGTKKKGMEELLQTTIDIVEQKKRSSGILFSFSSEIEKAIQELQQSLSKESPNIPEQRKRLYALKLLENDEEISTELNIPETLLQAQRKREEIEKKIEEPLDIFFSHFRHKKISEILFSVLKRPKDVPPSLSDKIDTVLLHKYFGLPIFFFFMYLLFDLTFTIGYYPTRWLQKGFFFLSNFLLTLFPGQGEDTILSLFVDGIIGGVGSVLSFFPNILILFFAIAILETSGYMTRAAFLMDRLMHRIGLHGKSFIPMLIGLGCSVPAILATRMLESKRDRIVSILVLPFIACSAKLVVFGLFIPPFFSRKLQPLILLSLYIIGISLAILAAKILRSTICRGENVPFIMELPSYSMPTISLCCSQTWTKAKMYLKKAGTIIFFFSIVMWTLSFFPRQLDLASRYQKKFETERLLFLSSLNNQTIPLSIKTTLIKGTKSATLRNPLVLPRKELKSVKNYLSDQETLMQSYQNYAHRIKQLYGEKQKIKLQNSYIGKIGRGIAPIFKPLGFDWRISTSLIGALASKEIFVAELGVIFNVEDVSQSAKAFQKHLQKTYSPFLAFCIMLFLLISTPCIATFAITKQETSWKWAFFQIFLLTFSAYGITALVYQIGSFFF